MTGWQQIDHPRLPGVAGSYRITPGPIPMMEVEHRGLVARTHVDKSNPARLARRLLAELHQRAASRPESGLE